MQKRWYDTESTISLAISMLRNSTPDLQDSTCQLLEKKFEEMGIKKSEKFIVFKVFDKRWYDEKENIYNALETIRCCDGETRRKLAVCIIEHLCDLVKS